MVCSGLSLDIASERVGLHMFRVVEAVEEIYEPRHLEQEEDEQDETGTARASVRAGKAGVLMTTP